MREEINANLQTVEELNKNIRLNELEIDTIEAKSVCVAYFWCMMSHKAYVNLERVRTYERKIDNNDKNEAPKIRHITRRKTKDGLLIPQKSWYKINQIK